MENHNRPTTNNTVPSRKVFTAKDLIQGGVGSRNFIYERLKDGSIPSTRLGDKYIICPEWVRDVLAWG